MTRFSAWTVALLLCAVPARAGKLPSPLLFLGSQSGWQTLDRGEGGGNPFASALIELMSRSNLRLADVPLELGVLTARKSNWYQMVDAPSRVDPQDWCFRPRPAGEKRLALVLAFTDYSASGGARSLPGARIDAKRVGKAFSRAGFKTKISIDPKLQDARSVLREFSRRSAGVQIAAIYTTGHGVDVDGGIFLLPGDYPVSSRNAALAKRALRLSEVSGAARGARVNLVFYAGCRDSL